MTERFSAEQMEQLGTVVANSVKLELANCGLRVDSGTHVDEVRRDMAFLRWFRLAGNRIAQRLGWFILAALASGAIYIAKLGLDAYLLMHGK